MRRVPDRSVRALLDSDLGRDAARALGVPLPVEHAYWSDVGAALGSAVYLPHERSVFLSSAYVRPDCRGRGLQRALVRARVRWARGLGARCVITYTTAENPASINNLIACGFRSYIPAWRWAGKQMLYWMLSL